MNQGQFNSNSKTFLFQCYKCLKKLILMYGKVAITCLQYQVYLYGSEAITYLNALLWVVTEPAL
jgi:hypothetical protein